MDRGTWQATIHRVAKNQIPMKRLSRHILTAFLLLSHLLKFDLRKESKQSFTLVMKEEIRLW